MEVAVQKCGFPASAFRQKLPGLGCSALDERLVLGGEGGEGPAGSGVECQQGCKVVAERAWRRTQRLRSAERNRVQLSERVGRDLGAFLLVPRLRVAKKTRLERGTREALQKLRFRG